MKKIVCKKNCHCFMGKNELITKINFMKSITKF